MSIKGAALTASIVMAAMSLTCDRQGIAIEEQLKDVRAEWTARSSALRARHNSVTADTARTAGSRTAGGAAEAQALARRRQVMAIAGQQALAGLDRAIEDEIVNIRTAANPSDALLEARLRMAAYFAAQEAGLSTAEGAIATAQNRGAP